MSLKALTPGAVALITGGAAGIGLAAARAFAARGLQVCVADLGEDRLAAAAASIAEASPDGASAVLAAEADVSSMDDLRTLKTVVEAKFGPVDVLMNNAGVQPGSALFGPQEAWDKVLAVNLWGVINGTRVFGLDMAARGRPGLIVNTGSKQGITTPPGDPAYNVAKAGVKAFTEALQHELRTTDGCAVTAHLLIPGFVFTGLTARGRTEKPAGAWTPQQTVEFMLARLEAGDFYILCPDNDVDRALDEKRMAWAMGDVIENRPPLSRWHPDWAEAFQRFVKGG